MEGIGSDKGSDYIANFAFVPPSPPRSNNPLELAFDYPSFDPTAPITSPPLPHTSSYNDSYYSPYSQHSELSFSGDDIQLPDFPTGINVNEYEPSDYDAPNPQGSSLLMFTNDSDYMSPHYSTNNPSESHRSPFDHSSPSSNNSGVEENNKPERSRPSSVASNHPSPSLPPISHSPQPSFHPSPRLSVNFGNMSVHTPPTWGTVPLPQLSPNLSAQSPLPAIPKAQSPPRLLMPDDQQQQQNVPIINAPHGDDDMMNGPQLHIVPATPVSGGGVGRSNGPFQTTLATLSQELSSSNDQQQQAQSSQQQHQRDPSPSRYPGTEDNTTVASSSRLSPNNNPNSSNASNNTGGFIFPPDNSQPQSQQSRTRTHSDPWNPSFPSQQGMGGLDNGLNLNVGTGPNAGGAYNFQRQQLQNFTFGGTAAGGSSTSNGNGFLSPDSSLRRSVSDSSRMLHRHSRSEDIRLPPMSYSNNPGYHHQQSNSMGGTTSSSGLLYPPQQDFQQPPQYLHPSHVPNMINSSSTSPSGQPNLSLLSAAGSASNPNLSNAPIRALSPAVGHFRRASSGTRSDRGAEVWQGHHGISLATPRRMSPYPSPNASPRVRYGELELDSDLTLANGGENGGLNGGGNMGLGLGDFSEPPVSAGFSEEIGLSGRGTYSNLDVASVGGGGSQKAESVVSNSREPSQTRQSRSNAGLPNTDVLPSQIPKVNVTTGRTANASHRRRKQDANFACTVPGCGSTFTRGFNLKGHLRSHFEEKPYKCNWPGCGKGFARQHDCKRHEQLHSNFRPFECDGCRKQFARMDALNRHLRSEAGVECARIVDKVKGEGMGMRMGGGGGGYGMELGMESDDEKRPIVPKRRQTADWSGVAL